MVVLDFNFYMVKYPLRRRIFRSVSPNLWSGEQESELLLIFVTMFQGPVSDQMKLWACGDPHC